MLNIIMCGVISTYIVSFVVMKYLRYRNELILDQMFGNKNDILNSESLEQMSKYADSVCVQNAKKLDFNKNQIEMLKDPKYKDYEPNGTSYGNIDFKCTTTI
jgi:hypothetical protein